MSNEVDERVVSLEFDNQNFESNVATSMSTLDKLKAKLNNTASESGNSLESISQAASTIDLTSLSSSVEALSKRFSVMGIAGMTAITNVTNKLMNLTTKASSFLTSGIISGGLNRAMNLQNAQFQMSAVLGSAEEVTAVMNNVKTAVDGTAYSLDAAATVASQFAASGMKAGEQMETSLKAVSGVAAMTNSSYEDIGRIFTQVAGQGKLMGDQLLQLSSRGMNAAADLASVLGKTEAEVRTMVSKGEIDANTFFNAMSEKYSESAYKANETVNGTISNIKSALSKIGEKFYTPIIETNGPLVKFLNAIRTAINSVKDAIGPFVETLGKRVGATIEKLTPYVEKIGTKAGEILTSVSDKWSNLFNLIAGKNFKNIAWDQLSTKITDAGVSLDEFQSKFIEVAKQYGEDVSDLEAGTDTLGSTLMKMDEPATVVKAALQSLSEEYQNNGVDAEKLQAKLEYLQTMVDQVWYGTWNNQPYREGLLEAAGHDYHEIQDLVNKTVDQHRLTLADLDESTMASLGYTEEQIQVYKDLAAAAADADTDIGTLVNDLNKKTSEFKLYQTLQNISASLKKVFEAFKASFDDAFTPFKDHSEYIYNFINQLEQLSEKLLISDDTASKITKTFKGLWAAIDLVCIILRNTVGAAGKVAWKVFQTLAESIGLTFDNVLDVTAAIGDAIVAVRDWVKEHETLGKVLDSVGRLIANVVLAVTKFVKKLWEIPQVQNTVKKFFEFLVDFCEDFGEGIETVLDGLSDFIQKIAELASSGDLNLQNIFSAFGNVAGNVAAQFGVQDWTSIGSNICAGLMEGVKSFGQNVIDTAVDVAKKMFSEVCDFLGIHSPSTKMKWVGQMCGEGFIEGLKSTLDKISDIVGQLVDKLVNSITSASAQDVIVTSGFIASLGIAYKTLKTVDKVVDLLGSSIRGVNDVIKNFAGILSSVSNAINILANAKAKQIKIEAFYTFAKAIAVLATALGALSMFDQGKLLQSAGILAGLVTVMTIMARLLASSETGLEGFAKAAALILSISVGIALIASALKKLATIQDDPTGLGLQNATKALGIMVGLIGLIVIIMGLVSGLTPNESSGTEYLSFAAVVVSIGVAMKMMASALKKIAALDQTSVERASNTLNSMIILIGAMFGILASLDGLQIHNGNKMVNIGKQFLEICAGLVIIATAVKLLSTIDTESLNNATKTLLAMTFIIGVVYVAGEALQTYSRVKGEGSFQASNVGKQILEICAGLALVAVAVKLLSSLDLSSMSNGFLALSGIALIVSGLIIVVNKVDAAGEVGTELLKISAAIAILAIVAKKISELKTTDIFKGIAFMGAMTLFVEILIGAMKNTSAVGGVGTQLLAVAAALGIMAVVVRMVGDLDTETLTKGVVFMGVLMVFMGLFLRIAKLKGGENAAKLGALLMSLAVALGVCAIVCRLVADLEPSAIIKGILFMTAMITFMSMMVVASHFAGAYANQAGNLLMKMAVPIAAMAVIAALLTQVDQSKLATSTACITALIAVFTLLMRFGTSGDIGARSFASIIVMTTVVAALAGALVALSALNVQNALQNATALSEMMIALTACIAIISTVAKANKDVKLSDMLKLATVIGILGLIGASLTAIMGQITQVPSQECITAMTQIMAVLTVLSVLCVAIGKIGGAGVIGAAAEGATSIVAVAAIFVTAFVALTAAFGYFDQLLDLQGKIESGFGVLKAVAKGIGEVANAFLEAVTSGLADIGKNIGDFISNIIDGLSGISDLPDNIGSIMLELASALLAFTGAGVITSLTSFLGIDGLGDLSTKMPQLAEGIKGFSDGLDGINVKNIKAGAKAIEAVASLQSSMSTFKALVQKFTGIDQLDQFADNLKKLGPALKKFQNGLPDEINTEKIGQAVKALKKISEVQSSLSNLDSLTQKVTGIDKLQQFIQELPDLAGGLIDFQDSLTEDIQTEKITNAITALKSLAEVQGSLSNLSSVVEAITGFDSFANFAENLQGLGEGLVAFSTSVSTDGAVNADAINNAVACAKKILTISDDQDWLDNLVASWTGSDLDGLGESLESFGGSLAAFGVALSSNGFDAEQVSAAVQVAKKIINIPATIKEGGDGSSDLATLGTNIVTFGTKMGEFCSKISQYDFETIASSMKTFSSSISALQGIDFSAITQSINGAGDTGFGDAASKMMESMASGIEKGAGTLKTAMTNAAKQAAAGAKSASSAFKTAGTTCANKFKAGITSGASGAKTAAKTMATNAASAATKTGKFKTAGRACAEGFAAGITAGSSAAITAAVNMAVAAYNAAKTKLDVNSPSKLFRKMALCVPEGFAQGIERGTKWAVAASENMATASIDSTREALNKVANLNLDAIDANPTITPMVDLSNVTAGANRIASMLNLNPSVGLATNLGAINSGMSSRIQNGQNNDVVNALQDLKRTITKSAKPTYNINGVTYDDGSNVSQAVGDLVRAVKVEGRM